MSIYQVAHYLTHRHMLGETIEINEKFIDEVLSKFGDQNGEMLEPVVSNGTLSNGEITIEMTVVIYYQKYTEDQAREKNCLEPPEEVGISKSLNDHINERNIDITGFKIYF